VSRACEEKHKTPILGMEAAWNPALDDEDVFHLDLLAEVTAWRKTVAAKKIPPPVFIAANDSVNDGREQHPPSHGGFDNDIVVVTRTLNRILGQAEDSALPSPIDSLAGF
jgi:hypothetical protein